MEELDVVRYLRIVNEDDRVTVASILFKNGYDVAPVRAKKNGRSYEYYVSYAKPSCNIVERADGDES